MRSFLIVLVAAICAFQSAPLQAQSSEGDYSHLQVPSGEVVLPGPTEAERLTFGIANHMEPRSFSENMECRSLFELLLNLPDSTEAESGVYQLAFHTYNNVINAQAASGGAEGYKPGVISRADGDVSISEDELFEAMRLAYPDCIKRQKSALKAYEQSVDLAKSEAAE